MLVFVVGAGAIRALMRLILIPVAVLGTSCAGRATPPSTAQRVRADTSIVRRELQQWYEQNKRAFLAKDLEAIMALRTEDFHAVTPDGAVQDRAAMEHRTLGLLNGIDRWIEMTFDLDSIEVEGDLARAVVRQHLVRMALRPDDKIHHVETWVTQREAWRRTPGGWKLHRVDRLRDQRRLVDGEPD
jgi:ketosteroid isomerase-like protein